MRASLIAIVLFVSGLGAVAPALAQPVPAPSIHIQSIDESPVDAGPVFIERGWITGNSSGMTSSEAVVQLAAFYADGWHVLPASATPMAPSLPATPTSPWAVRIALPPADDAVALRWRIKALLTRSPLPVGRVADPAVWRAVVAQSDEVPVWRASFRKSSIAVLEAGGLRVTPGLPLPVSQLDTLTFETSGVPEEAVVQTLVRANDSARVWPQQICHVVRGRGSCNAVFGRSKIVASRFFEEDLNVDFVATVVVSTRPLPIKDEGFDGAAWRALSPLVKASSDPVRLVRAIPLDGVRVAINAIGSESDGQRWMVPPVARVSGSFATGPRYQQRRAETVTLLFRAPSSPLWLVAGSTRLTLGNRALWYVVAANFRSPGEYRAIAAVSLIPFASDKGVTEDMLTAQALAVSEERRFHVAAARGEERRP